ncbi:hypothetical protein ACJJTC_016426 [Scirpophaga incertulas]
MLVILRMVLVTLMSVFDWLSVTWAQGGMQLQANGAADDLDSVKGRCGRAGSLAATPGEKLMELLRPSVGAPRRHSTAACAPPPRPTGFVYCPSDALPYCPPSRIAPPPRPVLKLPLSSSKGSLEVPFTTTHKTPDRFSFFVLYR